MGVPTPGLRGGAAAGATGAVAPVQLISQGEAVVPAPSTLFHMA
jgi:hypothetical protein